MDFSGGSNYHIVPINSFEEAQQYYEYTNPDSRWCLTHMENMYDSYTCNGMNQIYFCLRNGFEYIEPIVGEDAPLDEYGLSMLSIIVNEMGELAFCTTRWNHDNGGSDQSMTAKEVSQVVGVNFYQVFKPNNKWNDLLAEVKERLSNGEYPRDIFDYVEDFSEGFAKVKLKKKWNLLTTEGQLLSNQWYDWVYDFSEGFAEVKINGKGYNFINTEGQLLSNQWYDKVDDFKNGFACVKINGKGRNFINTEGQLLSNQWYDLAYKFSEGFAKVELNNKWNFINTDGQLLTNQWYDDAKDFNNGFVRVYIKGEGWNFLNEKGQYLTNQWYDGVDDFHEGFAEVKINGKGWNFINTEGQYLTNQWYDYVGSFKNGYAEVRINFRWKLIDKNGKVF